MRKLREMFRREPNERRQRVDADTERTRRSVEAADLSTQRTDDALKTIDEELIRLRLRLIERQRRKEQL